MPDYSNIEQYFKDNNIDIANLSNIGYQLKKNNDILLGGIRSSNVKQLRNIYVINAQDSLDDTYPLYMHFNIISEMTKIVSLKLSFWLLPFRAYATTDTEEAAATSGATGSASGGGSTSGSGGSTTPTSSNDSSHSVAFPIANGTTGNNITYSAGNLYATGGGTVGCQVQTHTHIVAIPNHTHTTPDHTHPTHTHSVPAHTHGLTFGIHEEDNSPTIGFAISRDNGATYGAVLGTYTDDVANLEIKDYITASGSYIIRFTSSARARLSCQLTCKLDISAR